MSGGTFDYRQHEISNIARAITDELIQGSKFQYASPRAWPPEIASRMQAAIATLHRATAMAQRIDHLLAHDDGPEQFIERWVDEGLDTPL